MNAHRPSERTGLVAAGSPHVTRVDRTLSLDVGTFWRPRAVNDDGTRDGSVVLSEIHEVNGQVHSVQVLQHPRHWHDGGHASYESLLLDDFLAAYEPDPRGQRTRDEDLAEANARVRDEQRLLEDLQSPLGGWPRRRWRTKTRRTRTPCRPSSGAASPWRRTTAPCAGRPTRFSARSGP